MDKIRFSALDHLRMQKIKVEKAYNKKVKLKTFSEEELVMKAILPIGLKDPRLGKWSPNWEGPFKIHQVLRGGAYHLKNLDGQIHNRLINGKYLKKYKPCMWETYVRQLEQDDEFAQESQDVSLVLDSVHN